MTEFMALLRKDCRLNRVPVLGLAAMTAGCYAFVCLAYVWNYEHLQLGYRMGSLAGDYLGGAAEAGLFLTSLVAAAFGGIAFAQERREGWGDFLAQIPVAKEWIILSKLIVNVACLLLFFAINLSIALSTHSYSDAWFLIRYHSFLQSLCVAAVGLSIFGMAWLFSSILRSDTISACAALAAEWAILTFFELLYKGFYDQVADYDVFFCIHALIAVVTIYAGAEFYRRRVSP